MYKTSKNVKNVIIELEMNIYFTETTLKCNKIPIKIKHKMKEIWFIMIVLYYILAYVDVHSSTRARF